MGMYRVSKIQTEEVATKRTTDEERYLQLCEDLFAIAEDFNRDEHTKEALILKKAFAEISEKLSEEQQKELRDNMDSRGL